MVGSHSPREKMRCLLENEQGRELIDASEEEEDGPLPPIKYCEPLK